MVQNNKYKLIFSLLVLLFIFAAVALYFLISSQKPIIKNSSPTPFPVPTDLNTDYSNFNLLVPGGSTIRDVERISGAPASKSTFGDKTVLYYKTPSDEYKNIVVIKSGLVYYAVENIFGNYRGTFDRYVSVFGEPDIKVYQPRALYPWYIFLKSGVGIQSIANGEIAAFLYFAPQDQNSFMINIARDLGLSINPPNEDNEGVQFTPEP